MKYLIAIVTAFLLIAGMYAFRTQMMSNVAAWDTANATISPFQRNLVRIAYAITRYWYALTPLIVIACLAIVALIPKRRDDEQTTSPGR